MTIASAAPTRGEDLGRGAGGRRAVEAHLADLRGLVEADEVVLEVEPALVGPDARAHRVVAHGQDGSGQAEGRLERQADGRQALTGPQSRGPHHVGRQVTVAQPEPRRLAVALQHRRRGIGLPGESPALDRIGQAGQGVHDGVEVGHHRQPVELQVVARVDDDRQVTRREHLLQAVGQLGPADPAGQSDDRHASGDRRRAGQACRAGRTSRPKASIHSAWLRPTLCR